MSAAAYAFDVVGVGQRLQVGDQHAPGFSSASSFSLPSTIGRCTLRTTSASFSAEASSARWWLRGFIIRVGHRRSVAGALFDDDVAAQATSFLTTSGDVATRVSPGMRSLGTAIFISDSPALVVGRFAGRLCTVAAAGTSLACGRQPLPGAWPAAPPGMTRPAPPRHEKPRRRLVEPPAVQPEHRLIEPGEVNGAGFARPAPTSDNKHRLLLPHSDNR